MPSRDFLVEIGTEELPPKALDNLAASLEQGIVKGLNREELNFTASYRYATPRRLAVLIHELQPQQADKTIERLGPAVSAAFTGQGAPTKAAQGFARSCGVAVEELDRSKSGDVEKLVFSLKESGRPVQDLLPRLVRDALEQLPVPKRMRWGNSREEFVRPVHWVVMMYGNKTIPALLLGVEANHFSYGHRFNFNKKILIKNAKDYEALLEEKGGVIPDFNKRKGLIRELVENEGAKAGAVAFIDEALLDEVTGLVEYPVALTGKFEEEFLDLPPEALILTMKSHQKCFYLVDKKGKLLPKFITISNLQSKDPSKVVEGYERVIRPRLADARFFYETDKKHSLESRLQQLNTVIFQEKLGTIYEKSQRVAALTTAIAERIGADSTLCSRAATLAKCDLLTLMVGEFADLQGLMGFYYALHDGEPEELAQALNEQYMPRFSGDSLPNSKTGIALALADKLDSIVGIFGIGQPPTGSKDPFALRRSAIGVLRIIVEKELDLDLLYCIEQAVSGFEEANLAQNTADEVFEFMLERFKAWFMDKEITVEEFQSVFVVRPTRPLDFHLRILAVHNFNLLPESASLAEANKRVSNLLAKQNFNAEDTAVKEELLQEPAEKALHRELVDKILEVAPLLEKGLYKEGLQTLASLKISVDTFFDEVLVVCEDASLRENRLALLQQLRDLFLQTADISHLHKS
ncbi:MAG: glycine--tRNA ligase subunit beta [Gammaproteobacteria bacterium]|nr:glycine--tRNA ligase subunit beta [Gammaproteobacteria bacterium]|tara:strand:- start:10123 stop:12201 length:2079 start_codon:yes stop_codon:yes gene_type:complete